MDEKRLKKKKEKAITEGNSEQLYVVCKELGDVYLQNESYSEALQEYEEALQVAMLLGNQIFVAVANRMIGEALCFTGEFEEAIRHQKIHLQISRDEKNLIEEQRALATVGRTYFVKAESCAEESEERVSALEQSLKYYIDSLDVCGRLTSEVNSIQLSEMKSRLFLNLGLTSESLGDINSAFDYISRAVDICKELELRENLCRCYISQAALSIRQSDIPKALIATGEGLQVAECLENRVQLSCELLSLKADALIDLADYQSAKQCLIQAYKLKTLDAKERRDIERKLRIAVVLYQSESQLLITSEVGYKERKMLNEMLGDCCVALQRYKKAAEYYENMLQYSLRLGENGRQLVSAYVSLSQTYKDDKQYELALTYLYKELELYDDEPLEACKTLLNIIVTLDLQQAGIDRIMLEYEKATQLINKVNDKKLKIALLRTVVNIHEERKLGHAAREIKRELEKLSENMSENSSDDDESVTSENLTTEIGADINFDDLSDFESDRDEEYSSRKRHRSTFTMKRNEKGETSLHVAAAKGNLQLVTTLLKQGHPVHVQDAVGWLPLHEACNHGHVAVVEKLLDAGANCNDRGGPGCEGVTPLHDAASSGHLDVIDLLLDRGASPLARTDKGETVLDCLKACHDRVVAEEGKELDPVTFSHYNSIVARLEDALKKVGASESSNFKTGVDRKIRKLPALLDTSETDDWLEDDIGDTYKRPAKRRCEEFPEMPKRIVAKISTNKHRQKKAPFSIDLTTSERDDIEDMWYNELSAETNERVPITYRSSNQNLERTQFRSQMNQLTITQSNQPTISGYSAIQDIGTAETSDTSHQDPVIQTHITQQTTPMQRNVSVHHSVKVRVEDKLLYIPIPDTYEQLDIEWLISETARRYYNLEGVTPVISLTTEDGALLDLKDPLSIVLESKELHALIASWNLAPLTERYKEACRISNVPVDSYIELQLDMCQASSSFSVKDCCIPMCNLQPALKAIGHYHSLTHVSFSGIELSDQDFKVIVDTIVKLSQLQSFDASTNNITNVGFSHLVSAASSYPHVQNLRSLNMSFNPLGDESVELLAKLTNNLPLLNCLMMKRIGITSQAFYSVSNFLLDHVEILDVSCNQLSRIGMTKFFCAMNRAALKELYVGRTGGPEVLQECVLFFEGGVEDLNMLDVSNLDLGDEDVLNLVRSLENGDRLTTLNLSCNERITANCHEHLNKLTSLKKLYLDGCSLITPEQLYIPFCELTLSSEDKWPDCLETPYNCIVVNSA